MTPRRTADWSYDAGFSPWKVTVYEEPTRKGVLYLRWRKDGNWKRESLKRRLRNDRGRVDPEIRQWATERAEARFRELQAGLSPAERAQASPLTIAEGLTRVTDPRTGKYPVATGNRREVVAALKMCARLWGADRTWNSVTRTDLRALWRHRIKELHAKGTPGHRGAEITVARVLTVANWLKGEQLIATEACTVPRTWKRELVSDWKLLTGSAREPEPNRPRYTRDEARAILDKSWEVDPRLGLLLALGAELRVGQIRERCRRSDLTLERNEAGALEAGRLYVPGAGGKRGARVQLTPGQLVAVDRALTGYLAPLEATGKDYCLFPQGPLPGGRKGEPVTTAERHLEAEPIVRRTVNEWFTEAERLAGIVPVPGRGPYGLRRWGVDELKQQKASREALKAGGGWTDTQMPDKVYADQEMEYAELEAAEKRAVARGEVTP